MRASWGPMGGSGITGSWAALLAIAVGSVGACTLGSSGTRAGAGATTTTTVATGQGGAGTTTGQGGGATTSTGAGGVSAGGAGGAGTGGASTGGAGTGGSGAADAGASDAGATDAAPPDGGDAGVEDCLNGVDDDGDGKIDCADPGCTPDYECAPEAPVGWEGYFRVATGTYPVAPRPLCAGGVEPTALFTEPQDASCAPCACGALGGAACGPPDVTCWAGTKNCTGPDSTSFAVPLASGTCADVALTFPGAVHDVSCRVTTNITPGSCPVSGGAYEPSPPVATEVDRCGAPMTGGGGCKAGNVCIPKAPTSYSELACIQKDGAAACPGGWTQLKVGSGFVDDRACTPCSCAPDTKCSNAKVVVSDNLGCKGSTQDLADVACHETTAKLSNGGALQVTVPSTLTASKCAAKGGDPTGSVTLTGQLTICCK